MPTVLKSGRVLPTVIAAGLVAVVAGCEDVGFSAGTVTTGEPGRDGTEIDIIEKAVLVDQVEHNLHWDGYGTEHQGVGQVPNYVILSEEIGNFGTGPYAWGVGPIEDADLPDFFLVDYVGV